MQRDQIDLGTVKVSRLFRLYFFPTLMGMLSLCAVTAIDGIFVGHSTGSDGLAAVNICIAPTMVIVGIGLMLGVGASVVCSIHLARQRLKAARINATQALLAGVIAVLLFLALTLSAPRTTARILGCSDTLMPLVLDYMPWIFLCCLFQIFGAIGLFIVRLDGAPRYAMWCNLIPALLNIVLDYVFIFPLGMGLMGAGIATLISCAVGGTMALVYLIGYAGQLRLIRFKLSARSLHLTIRNLGYQCRIGISALLGEATMGMLMFMGNIVFMSYLGDDGVGAFSIACYYCPFVFMIGNAIAQSVQPIISYNYGQGKHHRVVQAERLAVICAGLCSALVTGAFVVFPGQMIALFLGGVSDAVDIAVNGFPLFAVAFVFFVFNLTAIGYFQAVEKAWVAIVFALLRGLVFMVPSFLLLSEIIGTSGIWLALGLSEALTSVCILGYYLHERRKARS